MRRDTQRYDVLRWGWRDYEPLRKRLGLTREQAMVHAEGLRSEFEGKHCVALITTFGLDNPFMTEEARLVMLSDVKRYAKPVLKNAEEAMKGGTNEL